MDADALDPLARIVFTEHAEERWTSRVGGRLDHARARGEIRSAIVDRRISPRLPAWARSGANTRDGYASDHALYVWDAAETRAWVVVPERGGAQILVKTLLARSRDVDDARLRPGLVRR